MSDHRFLLLIHLIRKVHPISSFFKALIPPASAFNIVCYIITILQHRKDFFSALLFSPRPPAPFLKPKTERKIDPATNFIKRGGFGE